MNDTARCSGSFQNFLITLNYKKHVLTIFKMSKLQQNILIGLFASQYIHKPL